MVTLNHFLSHNKAVIATAKFATRWNLVLSAGSNSVRSGCSLGLAFCIVTFREDNRGLRYNVERCDHAIGYIVLCIESRRIIAQVVGETLTGGYVVS